MITKEHLETFRFFNGNIDMWARSRQPNEQMTDDHWVIIEDILQKLIIVNNGQVSAEFAAKILQDIKSSCDNPQVEQEMVKMSKSL
jgi:hypothetical protein